MIGASKKLLQATAGNAGGAGPDVEDVFSTYLYTGNGSTQTITNGIDLDGEGGLVWIKDRTNSDTNHGLFDTERGVLKPLQSNTIIASSTTFNTLTAFNSNGFSLGNRSDADATNASSANYASWTWRKAFKFFDVVTYTGDGTNNRAIAHNLNTTVGAIFLKRTDTAENWIVYHTTQGNGKYSNLNSTSKFNTYSGYWTSAPTSTDFYIGSDGEINASGATYVAYLFAHNDGDGGFGPDGDQDIIKCGSYTGNGSTDGPEIDLGFEPQWLLVKRSAGGTSSWQLLDVMRGFTSGSFGDRELQPNASNGENEDERITLLPTGFKPVVSTNDYNASGSTYIYMAIRRGPLAPPESGTEVFAIDTRRGTNPKYESTFPVDFALSKTTGTGDFRAASRITQKTNLKTNTTESESASSFYTFEFNNGWGKSTASADSTAYSWMWKRAPGYFDVVAYTGNGSGTRTVDHNLGVAPDMLWLKRRDGSSPYGDWYVQSTGISATNYLTLNSAGAQTGSPDSWSSTYAASDVFTVGPDNNVSGFDYITYLFATLAGVSKVGSYTGNGSSQTIDCGFTSGARFVLIKSYNDGGDWQVFDTERGIVAGDDGRLLLNRTDAESNDDYIDPHSSGFSLPNHAFTNSNAQGQKYIFYAIA